MEFNYEFDCPMLYYDLSKHSRESSSSSNTFQSDSMIVEDERKQNELIDEWFLTPHEAPPKSYSDELFFAELEKRDEIIRRKSKSSFENNHFGSSSGRSRLSSQQLTHSNHENNKQRKRSISERSLTPSKRDGMIGGTSATSSLGGGGGVLAKGAMRNKSLLGPPVAPSSSSISTSVTAINSKSSSHFISNNENAAQNISTHPSQVDVQKGSFVDDSISEMKETMDQRPDKRRKCSTSSISSGPSRTVNSFKNSTNSGPVIQTRSQTTRSSKPISTTSASTKSTTASSNKTKTISMKPNSKSASKLGTASSLAMSQTNNEENKSIEEMLKEHNAKFAPVPVYEPSKHSFRDVRKWEKKNGKVWNDLKPEEREKVNQEITLLKNANLL